MDYILPAILTKRFGGSRASVIGSVIGLIVGLIFFAPWGMVIGPFLGAFVGELINNQTRAKRVTYPNSEAETGSADVPAVVPSDDFGKALIAALGAFLAFIVGTGAKLIVGALMIYYAVKALLP